MYYFKKVITILLLFFAITSCVEKYFPIVDKYEGVLVVDGILSNVTESTIVRLSISSPLTEEDFMPLSGASLNISDQNNVEIPLIETEPGLYHVLDNSFCGEIGNSYQLRISLPDGRSYESDLCILKSSAQIDSVYSIVESPEYQSGTHLIKGLQFYIDSHSNNISDTSYYLWKLSQTFKYKSTFDIDWVWEGYFYPFPDPDSLRTCWHTSNISEMYLFSTKFLDQPIITKFPLNYASTDSKALSIRYSLLVNQLSISEDAFNFFNGLNQQNIEQGDYYSRQPIQIVGNVHNVTNKEESVLGYFIVAGITKKRIYVNRPPIPFHYDICTPDFDLRFIEFYPESVWPIYIDDIMFNGWALGPGYECFDCRKDGGSITPPDFWED